MELIKQNSCAKYWVPAQAIEQSGVHISYGQLLVSMTQHLQALRGSSDSNFQLPGPRPSVLPL